MASWSSLLHLGAFAALATGAPACSVGSSSGGTGPLGSNTDATNPEAGGLFAPPQAAASGDSLLGVWGGTLKTTSVTFDVRYKLAPDSVTLANRCTLSNGTQSPIVGATAKARVTDDAIVVLESKSDDYDDGEVRCSVMLVPKQTPRCATSGAGGAEFAKGCFELEGTKLVLHGDTPLDKLELVKPSN